MLIRFCFGWREQMPSYKLKRKVLCGRSYTSPNLVLFGIIFDRLFVFYFPRFHNRITWLIHLPLSIYCGFLVCFFQPKFNVNLNFFTTKPRVCLVKYITTVSWYYSDHILLESCVSRNAYRCTGQSEAAIGSVLDFSNSTGKPVPSRLQLY